MMVDDMERPTFRSASTSQEAMIASGFRTIDQIAEGEHDRERDGDGGADNDGEFH